MNYIKAEDLRKSIEENSKEYILLDVRKLEDYKECHIKGSYSSDQDAATKAGDNERGRKNFKRTLEEVKGREKRQEKL